MFQSNNINSEESSKMFYCSDHLVPVDICEIINSREGMLSIGNSKFMRVMTTGTIKNMDMPDDQGRLELTIVNNGNELNVQKCFTTTFKRNSVRDYSVGDYVQVCGKIRLAGSVTFLNCFMIRKCSVDEYNAFQLEIKLCRQYFEKENSMVAMGQPTSNKITKELNLDMIGLTRFPMALLERSSVVTPESQQRSVIPTVQEEDSFDRPVPGAQVKETKWEESEDSFDEPVKC